LADDDKIPATERLASLKKAFAAEPKNSETSYDIGETLRLLSWEGGEGYRAKAEEAIQWFEKAKNLNRFDPYPLIRYGMCLDWLDKHREAEPYFKKAEELDPNGSYTIGHVGWHYFQAADYERSRIYFQRSLELYWYDNPIARAYLQILKSKIPEKTVK
jgi:tetratricopeptide (TPR) repeat protein